MISGNPLLRGDPTQQWDIDDDDCCYTLGKYYHTPWQKSRGFLFNVSCFKA